MKYKKGFLSQKSNCAETRATLFRELLTSERDEDVVLVRCVTAKKLIAIKYE